MAIKTFREWVDAEVEALHLYQARDNFQNYYFGKTNRFIFSNPRDKVAAAIDFCIHELAINLDSTHLESVLDMCRNIIVLIGLYRLEEYDSVDIQEYITSLGEMLLEKNRSYGNSALDPITILSKKSPIDGILMRLDDKFSRMIQGCEFETDDTILDIAGYIMMLSIAVQQEGSWV